MKKPLILISTSNVQTSALEAITGDTEIFYSDRATAVAVLDAGGLPIYLPSIEKLSEQEISSYLNIADGVLLTGADTDANPLYYDESPVYLKGRIDDERDRVDIQLIKATFEKKLPLLGICKGMQIINVALGGTLYQDIPSQLEGSFNHDMKKTNRSNFTHEVELKKKSMLRSIFKEDKTQVNSSHQQAVKKLSKKLKPVAIAKDGVIEAYEGKNYPFLLGIQFHAELRFFDHSFQEIFKVFIQAATK